MTSIDTTPVSVVSSARSHSFRTLKTAAASLKSETRQSLIRALSEDEEQEGEPLWKGVLEQIGGCDSRHAEYWLCVAARLNKVECMKWLLDQGVAACRDEMSLPAHVAILHRAEEAWNLLHEKGLINGSSKVDGRTMLMEASKLGLPGIVQKLLDLGVDVNESTRSGYTALHCAAVGPYNDNYKYLEGRLKVLPLLRNQGANALAKTYKGETPLQLVEKYCPRQGLEAFLL